MEKIITTSNYIRTLFIKKNIKIKFIIPVISFVYLSYPEKNEFGFEFNNNTKLREINILHKKNQKMYKSYILKKSGHCVFNKEQSVNYIIDKIKNHLNKNNFI